MDSFNVGERFIPDYIKINEPAGRLFVIADIHGCVNTFRKLLSKINLQQEDCLILLGDYINKGADSCGVLDTILELMQLGLQVWPLLGNHEKMLINVHEGYDRSNSLISLFLSNGLIDKDLKISLKYRELLLNLPYYYVMGNYYFVHAGFNFNGSLPFKDFENMLWIRNFTVPQDFNGTIYHGHVPTTLPTIEMNIRQKRNKICLDNGCFSKQKWFMGNLLCLEVKTSTLVVEENCD